MIDGHEFHSYLNQGRDWADIYPGAELCRNGKEQSPIDLRVDDTVVTDKMEINGYGYVDFVTTKERIAMPCLEIPVEEGEFILNLFDGKKQLFKLISFDLRIPSEHTVYGKQYDAEIHILHHYKGTDNQLGAYIAIFFDSNPTDDDEHLGEASPFLESIFKILDG